MATSSLSGLLQDSFKPWLNARVNNMTIDGNETIAGDVIYSGNVNIDGSLTVNGGTQLTTLGLTGDVNSLANASFINETCQDINISNNATIGSNLNISSADLTGDLIPSSDTTYNIGNNLGNKYKNISLNGNLNNASWNDSAFTYIDSTGNLKSTSAVMNGGLLIGQNGGDPIMSSIMAGSGISVVNGAGSITISSTGTGPVIGPADTVAYFDHTGSLSGDALLDGQLLIGSTGATPNQSTLTSGASGNLTVTNGAGSITLDILTTPTFSNIIDNGLSLNLPVQTGATKQLISSAIDLNSSQVTNILPIANGGTNSSTALTNNQSIISSSGKLVEGGAQNDGAIMIGSSIGVPAPAQIQVSANLTNTIGHNSISLDTIQGIQTTSSPTFANITDNGLSLNLPVQTGATKTLISSAINLNSSQVSGVLPIANGGTNSNTALANGNIMVSSGGAIVEGTSSTTPTFTNITDNGLSLNLPVQTGATKTLISSAINLNSSQVTNTLQVSNGGTGDASLTAYAVLCGGTTSTSPIQSIASVGSSSNVLTSNGAGALPTFKTIQTFTATGSGSGTQYTTTSTSYANVDGTNLTFTVTIPTGSKLLIWARALSNTNSASGGFVGIADGGTVIAGTAKSVDSAGGYSSINVNTVINGDGASHTITLQFATHNGGSAFDLGNGAQSSTGIGGTAPAPYMFGLLLPSL